MGLFGFFKSNEAQVLDELIAAGFEISSCDFNCSDCQSKYPSSMKVQDDSEGPLWKSTKPRGLHILVATGKTDWPHDATGTSGTLAHATSKWASSAEGKISLDDTSDAINVNTTSLALQAYERGDQDALDEKKGDLLLLPFFVWVRNVTGDNVGATLNKVVPELVKLRLNNVLNFPQNLSGGANVLVEAYEVGLIVFLCSHRTRDKKCGITAPILKKEMDLYLRDLGLYRDSGDTRPGGTQVAFINHIGGHKYAANVIVYLKNSGKNVWLARCSPNNVKPIIDETVVNDGKVWPLKVRLAQKHLPVAW